MMYITALDNTFGIHAASTHLYINNLDLFPLTWTPRAN